MINTIIWMGTLAALFFYLVFSTPTKPPAAITIPEYVEEAKTEVAKEAPVKKEVAPVETIAFEPVDINKGKEIYTTTCIKCHNPDPNQKGPIGPEMVDAPLEVMVHKVQTGRYPEVLPPGFVPKRKTKQMTKFPQFVKFVPSIHAYVQSLKKK